MVAIFESSPPGQCIVHWLGDSSGAKEEEIEIEAEERVVLVPDSEGGQSLGSTVSSFPNVEMHRRKAVVG